MNTPAMAQAVSALTQRVDMLRRQLADQGLFASLTALASMPCPIWHISAFSLFNAGDSLLVHALQRSVEHFLPQGEQHLSFINRHCHQPVNATDLQAFNLSQGIIIGGGGLFLKDTNANGISGWQFPISAQQLNALSVPLAVLAVGYNRFRGQDDFEPVFRDNLNSLIRSSCFVGIRNHGSIRRLRAYLDEDLHERLSFHPCATTILRRLYRFPPPDQHPPFIALNCAFDRERLRFGSRRDAILNAVASAVSRFTTQYEIKYYAHMPADEQMLPYLASHGINCELVRLYDPKIVPRDIMRLYADPHLVLGMRGHAQMIPFGCNTPILSLISHDKLAWFLEDIGHPEWGVEISAPNFERQLTDTMSALLGSEQLIRSQIDEAQEHLYAVTHDNIKILYAELRAAEQRRGFQPV